MQSPFHFQIQQQNLWLSPLRCLYWEEEKALIVADLHFGKTGHFRKNGIAIPQNIFKEDLQRLIDAIVFFKPEQVIAVGDLFHSHANKELEFFLKWRNDFSTLHFHLVKGNHDILQHDWYATANITVTHNLLQLGCFNFLHDIEEKKKKQETINKEQNARNKVQDSRNKIQETTNYFFSGHIHPGVSIKGLSKQNLNFPCFYFGKEYAVMPAFSRFTGFVNMKPLKHDKIFAIVNNAIIKM